ncbi:MAG: DUF2135 domain-containing protein [Leptospirales bacterium]
MSKSFKKQAILGFFLTMTVFLAMTQKLYAVEINLDKPWGGFTTDKIQKISGVISGFNGNKATLVVNGIPQGLLLTNGRFSVSIVPSPGNNVIEIKAGGASKTVSFFAKVPAKDIKIVLIWDTQTDVDLWVIDPKGEKCYYSSPSTSSGGNLDVDVTSGYGPETFTMAQALPGEYSVQVQYYSSHSTPITRVHLYVITYEGTPREQRQYFQFTMTKAHQVYQIAKFQIEEN